LTFNKLYGVISQKIRVELIITTAVRSLSPYNNNFCWRVLSFGVQCSVVRWKPTDDSEEHVAAILGSKSKPSKKPGEAELSLPPATAGYLLG
jgi:hypothetical protein